jgi:hypothetical protein
MAAYVRLSDLARRWVYTRRGIEKLIGRGGFPAPAITDGAGRLKLWHLSDIASYEDAHPELTSEEAKRRKVRSYAIGNLKKRRQGG